MVGRVSCGVDRLVIGIVHRFLSPPRSQHILFVVAADSGRPQMDRQSVSFLNLLDKTATVSVRLFGEFDGRFQRALDL